MPKSEAIFDEGKLIREKIRARVERPGMEFVMIKHDFEVAWIIPRLKAETRASAQVGSDLI